jgi:hypothetical protein
MSEHTSPVTFSVVLNYIIGEITSCYKRTSTFNLRTQVYGAVTLLLMFVECVHHRSYYSYYYAEGLGRLP